MEFTVSQHHRLAPLTLLPKSLAWLIWGVCGLVFYHLGWMIFAPTDPSGTVSIWARSNPLGVVLQAAVLVFVVTALSTALVGRILPDAGLFGACVGLAVIGLRGETVSSLLTSPLAAGADSSSWGLWFALEAAIWGAVVLGAAAVAFLAYQWCCRPSAASIDGQPTTAVQASMMAGADLLALPSSALNVDNPRFERAKHVAAAVIVGLIGMAILSMDGYARAIHHGQACFAVALTFYAASRMAHERFPLPSPLMTVLSVPLAAMMGYLWGWVQGDGGAVRTLTSHVPVSVYLRTAPLMYIAVGSAAVLAGFWAARRVPPSR